MLFLLYCAQDSSSGETAPEAPVAPVAIVQLTGGGGSEDDDLIVRYDLADDRDMQDLIMIFEAFRSLIDG